jgi:hypothetical protein
MPKLDVDYRDFVQQTNRLLDLRLNIAPLQPRYQKLVAEVLFLRVFALLERTIASITVKILCGAQYLDASLPLVMIGAGSALEAQYNMTTVGRRNRLFYLKWTQVSEIKKNVVNLIDPTDVFLTTLDLYNSSVEEMRHVRNHIAHRTSSTRAKFKPIVRGYYGAYLNSITPGTLLLSQRWAPSLIDRYMTTARILIRDLVRA